MSTAGVTEVKVFAWSIFDPSGKCQLIGPPNHSSHRVIQSYLNEFGEDGWIQLLNKGFRCYPCHVSLTYKNDAESAL